MNQYGTRARDHWMVHAPHRVAAMEDPVAFFTQLGEEIQAQVTQLATRLEADRVWGLENPGQREDNYLQEVSRRMTAHRIAEEVVMSQLAWIHDPSLPLDEARQEWEETRASDENLITWAERTLDSQYPQYSTDELEQKAIDWAIPMWFLEGLLAAEIPGQYAREHQEVLREAADVRFLHEVTGTP